MPLLTSPTTSKNVFKNWLKDIFESFLYLFHVFRVPIEIKSYVFKSSGNFQSIPDGPHFFAPNFKFFPNENIESYL